MDLVVRSWTEADAPALARAVDESLEHLRPWMPWAQEPAGVDVRRAWIRDQLAAEAAGGDRAYGLFVGDLVVGGCGLHARIGPGGLELGYWVHPAYTGRGLATRAGRFAVRQAFAQPGVDRVEIHHDVANAASGRVAAALGFAAVGELRRAPEAPAETGVMRVWRLCRPA
ncbi:MAG TPA: GNAT family N-acetyltransferase [Solirubrobacteraceae bacterium]|nr:GNAT family N-acetyltransferase [Solirubrobacteraceae bacterium]